jgi:hypothetical protein
MTTFRLCVAMTRIIIEQLSIFLVSRLNLETRSLMLRLIELLLSDRPSHHESGDRPLIKTL